MDKKLPFEEGASINKPPLFCSFYYKYWKARIKIFVESIVPNGPMKKVKRPNLIALPRLS